LGWKRPGKEGEPPPGWALGAPGYEEDRAWLGSMPSLRPLGATTLRVAPIAFGGNVFGWTADERRSHELLDRFVDRGFNLIDTADVYSTWVDGHTGGESESILGRWLARTGRRDEVLIATKVGMEMGSGAQGLSPSHIRASVDDSLRRLATDHIDLYQAHIDDASTPLVDTLATFADLVREGTVRAIGASNFSGARLREALQVSRDHGLPRFETLQPLYNLVDRAPFESDLEPVVRAEHLGVLTYSSLASGFLSGKYRTAADLGQSPRGSRRMARRLEERGLRIVDEVRHVAARRGVAPTTVALAWLLQRPSVTAPIVSATSVPQLDEVLAAADLTLSAGDLADLDRVSAP